MYYVKMYNSEDHGNPLMSEVITNPSKGTTNYLDKYFKVNRMTIP